MNSAAAISRQHKSTPSTQFAPRRFPGLLLGLCLAIFASKVVWYDMRIVFPALRGDVFRTLLTAQALALLPFIALALWKGLGSMRKSWVISSYLTLMVFGAVVVYFQGIEYPSFVAQDILKLLFIPTAFAMVWIDPPRSLGPFLVRIADVILTFQILKVLSFLILYHGRMGLYFGGVMDTFPFCIYAARYCTKATGSVSRDGLLAAAAMLILVIGQKRTLLVIVAVVCFYLLARNVGRVMQKPSIYFGGLTFLIGAAFFSGPMLAVLETHMSRVIVKTFEADDVIENSARLREIDIINYEMDQVDFLTRIVGFGHGASFDDDIGDDITGETLTHSVHFTPYAMYLRYGYIGWIFYGMTVLATFFAPERTDNRWAFREDILAIKSFGIAAIFSSITIYGLVDDMFVGFGLGALAISAHLARLPSLTAAAEPVSQPSQRRSRQTIAA